MALIHSYVFPIQNFHLLHTQSLKMEEKDQGVGIGGMGKGAGVRVGGRFGVSR